jgi:hypothetical protein
MLFGGLVLGAGSIRANSEVHTILQDNRQPSLDTEGTRAEMAIDRDGGSMVFIPIPPPVAGNVIVDTIFEIGDILLRMVGFNTAVGGGGTIIAGDQVMGDVVNPVANPVANPVIGGVSGALFPALNQPAEVQIAVSPALSGAGCKPPDKSRLVGGFVI